MKFLIVMYYENDKERVQIDAKVIYTDVNDSIDKIAEDLTAQAVVEYPPIAKQIEELQNDIDNWERDEWVAEIARLIQLGSYETYYINKGEPLSAKMLDQFIDLMGVDEFIESFC